MALALRHTPSGDDKLLAYIRTLDSACCVIQHDADDEVSQTHWHAIVYGKKLETLRAALKKADPSLTKQSYSLKTIKSGEESIYERYMCHSSGKGAPVVVLFSHGLQYTSKWAVEQNVSFWDAQVEFKKQAKTKNVAGWVEMITVVCRVRQAELTRMDVAYAVYDEFKGFKKAMDPRYMATVMEGVCAQLGLPSHRLQMARRLENYFLMPE